MDRGPEDSGSRVGIFQKLTSDAVTRPSAAISSRSNALFSNTRFFISAVCRDRQGVFTSRPLRPLPDPFSLSLSSYLSPSVPLSLSLSRSLFLSIGTAGHLSDGTWRDGRRKNNSSKDTREELALLSCGWRQRASSSAVLAASLARTSAGARADEMDGSWRRKLTGTGNRGRTTGTLSFSLSLSFLLSLSPFRSLCY